jgi:hypothetical protein
MIASPKAALESEMSDWEKQERQDHAIGYDRRRPGRVQTNNSHLIALFRDPASPDHVPQHLAILPAPMFRIDRQEVDALAFARGVVIGVIGGACLWGVIGFCIWRFW